MKHFSLLGMALFFAFLLPIGAEAQPWPDPVPLPAFPGIPDPSPATTGSLIYGNHLQFELKWGTVPDTLPRLPSPISESQDSMARWIYFWNFGDHTYGNDSFPTHIYPQNVPPDSFDVELSLKPIYSDDYDPFKKKKKKKVGNAVSVPALSYTAPNYTMIKGVNMNIELEANWRATRPGKGLTMAITYRPRTQSPVSGVIGFLHADTMMVILDSIWGELGEGEEVTLEAGYQSLGALRGRQWRFNDLSFGSGERTIFFDVEVPDTLKSQITDSTSVMCPVLAYIAYNDPDGGNMPPEEGTKETALTRLVGGSSSPSGGGASVATPFDDSYNFYQEIAEATSINWAADPNYILVEPAILSPGTSDQLLKYSVHFQNNGSASALNVKVRIGTDPLLAGVTAINNPDSSNVPLCLKLAPGSDSLRWDTGHVDVDPPPPCKLNALGDAKALGFSTDETWGKVYYTIQTERGRILRVGDTIRAGGIVYMDRDSLRTPVAIVPVGIPSFCYPGILGLKYTQHFANEAIRSGWGLGLTLRYGLGKVQNPNFEAHTKRRISKQNFPLFWWQGELGYGETSIQPGADSLRVCHLDITPVNIRYIAKGRPIKIGNTYFQRGWGISAGYTASYLLAAQHNGTDHPSLDQFGFGQRLDHSIAVSADFLNLIGRPGISFGAGWRWRNSNITGTREWYQNAFVYLHYTFSPRFRTEFGWLN